MSIDIGTIYANLEIRNAAKVEADISKTTSAIQGFQRSMQIAAGVLMRDLFYGFVGVIREATELGAQMQTLRNSFEAFTDAAGVQGLSIEKLRVATNGMVSDVDLLTQANRMLAAGLPVDQVEELFSGAIKLGKAMGIDASMAIEKLTLGLVRMSWRLMDDLGIIMRASTANEEYAKSIGVAVSSLTAEQKQTAWVVYGIKELSERTAVLGDNIGEADQMIDQFAASLENIQTAIGENLAQVPALSAALNTFAPMAGIMAANSLNTMAMEAASAGAQLTGLSYAMATASAVAPWIAWGAVIALLPTAVKGYTMMLHDLRMATDEVYRSQQQLNDVTDKYGTAVAASDSSIEAYINAQLSVQDAYRASLAAVDAYNDALRSHEALESRLEDVQRQKAIAFADFTAALAYARGETETYHAAQTDLTWSTADAEMTYNRLRDTLWSLQDGYAQLNAEMKLLQESDEDTTLRQMELRLQMDQLQLSYDKGNIKQSLYEKRMKRLRNEYAALNIESEKNRIEQFKLQDQLDETRDSMSDAEEKIDALNTADDQREQVLSDEKDLQQQLIESIQTLNQLRADEEKAIDTLKDKEAELATTFESQWLALKEEAFWLEEVNRQREQLAQDERERRRESEEARIPSEGEDIPPPSYPEPSTPNVEPTGTRGGASQELATNANQSGNAVTLSVNIGSVVGTDKATAEKTGEEILSYVVRGLRTRGVIVR